MWLAETAWRAVDASTIMHCWQKAGILAAPSSPVTMPDPIANAEKEVEESFDALQNTGALQLAN